MTTSTEPNALAVTLSLSFTTFADHAAAEKREATWTWQQLVEYLTTPKTYPSKGVCPWIKLARFGEIRSAHNSLRHNANVVAITGIEGDYDAGQVTLADAATMLADAGVVAVFYTSPSHTPERPRWRVLCPLS